MEDRVLKVVQQGTLDFNKKNSGSLCGKYKIWDQRQGCMQGGADRLRAQHAEKKPLTVSIFGCLDITSASQDILLNLSSPGCSGARTNRRVRAYTIFLKKVTTSTYQADQNEKNKCYFSEDRPARYVAVACERKGCAFMQIKQPSSTYLLWTL